MTAKLTDASEKLAQAYERSRDVLGTVAGETKDLYHDARTWLPDNYGRVVVLTSAAAGVGLIGYLVGRRSRSMRATAPRPGPLREMGAVHPEHVPEFDIAPFFKFLKLWMLYRVATKD
jgi:hypothetical protein